MKRAEFTICLLLIVALTFFLWASAHAQASATDTATTGDSASAVVTPPPPAPVTTDPPAARGVHPYRDFLAALDVIFERVRFDLVGNEPKEHTR